MRTAPPQPQSGVSSQFLPRLRCLSYLQKTMHNSFPLSMVYRRVSAFSYSSCCIDDTACVRPGRGQRTADSRSTDTDDRRRVRCAVFPLGRQTHHGPLTGATVHGCSPRGGSSRTFSNCQSLLSTNALFSELCDFTFGTLSAQMILSWPVLQTSLYCCWSPKVVSCVER